MGWFRKNRKYTIEYMERLSHQLEEMNETVNFFTGIAELFAKYIVFDLKTSMPHGRPREKEELINMAYKYLQNRSLRFKGILRW